MRSMLWKPLVLLVLPLCLVLACSGDSDDPYQIGAMDALTGVAESYGNPILQAKLLAVEEINAAGGIDGRMLELIVEDSKCAAADAITAYNKLTDVDDIKIILGATCSGSTLGAAPLAEAEGVVMLSASATSPDIASAGDYIFRTAINDLQLGIDIGNTMWVDGPPRHRHHHRVNRLCGGRAQHVRCTVRGARRIRGRGGRLLFRRRRLPQSANEADQRQPRRNPPRSPRRGRRRDGHEAGPRAGLRRPDLLGDRAHRARSPEYRGRRRYRPESDHPQPEFDHRHRQGLPLELPGSATAPSRLCLGSKAPPTTTSILPPSA